MENLIAFPYHLPLLASLYDCALIVKSAYTFILWLKIDKIVPIKQ